MTLMGYWDLAAVLHINNFTKSYLFFSPLQARFLLSKVNPSQTHNNMYAWGQVSARQHKRVFFARNID